MTYDQAARYMGVSPHTVGTYIKRIHKKIGNGNTASVAMRAIELGELLMPEGKFGTEAAHEGGASDRDSRSARSPDK
jgi:hypothetical protein